MLQFARVAVDRGNICKEVRKYLLDDVLACDDLQQHMTVTTSSKEQLQRDAFLQKCGFVQKSIALQDSIGQKFP